VQAAWFFLTAEEGVPLEVPRMSKIRFAMVGVGAALALFSAVALANVGSLVSTNNDSHGDAVASAARGCPHGPNGVHGQCVSAIASSKSESDSEKDATCTSANRSEDTSETNAGTTEDGSETSANPSKSAEKTEDRSEKTTDRTEDKTENKACEAPEASNP
jgi:hypothetical protein